MFKKRDRLSIKPIVNKRPSLPRGFELSLTPRRGGQGIFMRKKKKKNENISIPAPNQLIMIKLSPEKDKNENEIIRHEKKKKLMLHASILSHCYRLGWLHCLGSGDRRGLGRKKLHRTIMRSDSNEIIAFCTEMMAIVAHFHAKW